MTFSSISNSGFTVIVGQELQCLYVWRTIVMKNKSLSAVGLIGDELHVRWIKMQYLILHIHSKVKYFFKL